MVIAWRCQQKIIVISGWTGYWVNDKYGYLKINIFFFKCKLFQAGFIDLLRIRIRRKWRWSVKDESWRQWRIKKKTLSIKLWFDDFKISSGVTIKEKTTKYIYFLNTFWIYTWPEDSIDKKRLQKIQKNKQLTNNSPVVLTSIVTSLINSWISYIFL